VAAADRLLSSETVATVALLQACCKLLLPQQKRGKLMSEKKNGIMAYWHTATYCPTPLGTGLYTGLVLYCYVNHTLNAIICCLEKYLSNIIYFEDSILLNYSYCIHTTFLKSFGE